MKDDADSKKLFTNNPRLKKYPPLQIGARQALSGGGKADSGSTFSLNYGRRPMKAYPITDGELGQLFGLGTLAAICFSLASGLLGFGLDLVKDLALSNEIAEVTKTYWETTKNWCFAIGFLLFVVGVVFVWQRRSRVSEIKKETTFPEQN